MRCDKHIHEWIWAHKVCGGGYGRYCVNNTQAAAALFLWYHNSRNAELSEWKD
jgi:hypothetical protein